jgi:D-arabinose 1-dehydrogenase-like Zn-dependent alcohol dehydrogenase
VGKVVEVGKSVKKFKAGDLAGAGWFYSTCGRCKFCKEGLKTYPQSLKELGRTLMAATPVFFASFYFSALGIAGLIFAKAFGRI